MNLPRPNLAIFAAHPPPDPEVEKRKRGRPKKIKPNYQQVENARAKQQHAVVLGEWVDELPASRMRATDELLALLKSQPGRWRRLKEVKSCGGYGNLRKAGAELATRIDTDGKRYAFARWPEGK